MLRPGVLPLCLVALCVACQPQPKVYDVERARTYAEDKAVVWDGVLRFLAANDITVVGADPATGIIHAERTEYQDAGWADCERAWVIDRTSDSPRPRRARPISRDLALEVAVRETSVGAEVQPGARFTEIQNDRWRNLPFTQPCRSTGMLERALLDSLDGAHRSALLDTRRKSRHKAQTRARGEVGARARSSCRTLSFPSSLSLNQVPMRTLAGKNVGRLKSQGTKVENSTVNLAE